MSMTTTLTGGLYGPTAEDLKYQRELQKQREFLDAQKEIAEMRISATAEAGKPRRDNRVFNYGWAEQKKADL